MGEDPMACRAFLDHPAPMKKRPRAVKKNPRPARRETSALDSEQLDNLASHIFWGNGREPGSVSEHWPAVQVEMLVGPPANRVAL